jgi:hypothetical protein
MRKNFIKARVTSLPWLFFVILQEGLPDVFSLESELSPSR